jgi:hypothetical protein
VKLAEGSTGCGDVAGGGCLFPWNFSVTSVTVLMEADRKTR